MDLTSDASPMPEGSHEDNPAPPKRVRDYGQELKGLSPSADEGSPDKSLVPASKKRRLDCSNCASGSDSESLDDGEIVESPSATQAAPSISPKVRSGTGLGSEAESNPLNVHPANVPAKASPDDDKTSTPLDSNSDLSQMAEAGEGKSLGESQEHGNTSSAHDNRRLGTRTTFTTKPASPFPAALVTADQADEQQSEVEKKRVRLHDRVSSFEASNAIWNFPLDSPQVAARDNVSEEDDFWITLLKRWITLLIQANDKVVTHKVVRSGWSLYFTKRMGFLQGTKKHSIATRLVAQNFMTSIVKNDLEAMISDARQSLTTDHAETTGPALASQDKGFRTQSQEISDADDSSQHSRPGGHTKEALPKSSCRFCKHGNHNSFGCPTRRRCGKCHQIGHTVDACPEKLALTPDELGDCAFCNANHLDQDCFGIWTSFKPSETNMKRVKCIPAFCYVCGGEDHYGPECSLAGNGHEATGHTIWSKATRDLYIDSECEDIAIAWIDVKPQQFARGNSHIPGRATRKNHTYFVSSESEDDLIKAPLSKPPPRGTIKFASNIGVANGNQRGQGDRHSWQPPLPPGPPPPIVAENEQRRAFQPKSSAFQGRQHVRGRGGFRGRGRGRK